MRCGSCGFGRIREEIATQRFAYGQDAPVELSATVPVLICTDCGDTWCDHRAEDARTAAVNAHLAGIQRARA
jgi:hypothetical protein